MEVTQPDGHVIKTVVETKPAPFPAPVGSTETKVTITQTDTPVKQFGRWALALWAGFIKGGAHAITSGTAIQLYDPHDFWPALTRYGVIFVSSGVVSAMLYLQRNPVPKEWNSDTDPDRRKEDGK